MDFIPSNSENRLRLNYLRKIRYWHRPGEGLYEVGQAMKEKGVSSPTLLDTSHMELYIGSLFGLALQETEKKDFWISKPQENPPDMAIMVILEDEKGRKIFGAREIEITRYRKEEKGLIDTILAKDQPHAEEYCIVCLLEFQGNEELRTFSDELIKKLKHTKHVFLVFNGMPFSSSGEPPTPEEMKGKVSVLPISPVFVPATVIDVKECLDKWKADDRKIVYTDNAKVYEGLREGDTWPQKIIK